MPTKNKKGRRKSELLQYQVATYVNRRVHVSEAARDRAQTKAMREFLRTGKVSVQGVKIVCRWRNPDNKNPEHANWKTTDDAGQSIGDFWKTLHRTRGALRALAARYL